MIAKITRRAILAAFVASPAIALPSVASAIPEPVGELSGLVARFMDARRRACDATTAREECAFAVEETYPKRPASLMGVPYWCADNSACHPLTADDINKHYDARALVLNLSGEEIAKLGQKRAALLRKLAKWEAREQAILESADWRALKAAEDALDAEADDLEARIVAYEARTIADVAAKVRFLGYWRFDGIIDGDQDREGMGIDGIAFLSLLADVERLAKKGGAA